MPALTQEDFIKDFTSEKVSIRLNEEKNGVEVKFADIPLARRENTAIKAAGFRWSGRQQLWYAKQNENSLAYAVSLRSQILNEMEQNGGKTYSAKEFNAEIEKELKSALNPKQSYENIKTENVSEIDGELEKLLRQQEELNRKIAELRQKQTDNKSQKNSLDKSSFNKQNVNSCNYNNLHFGESAEENYESEKSSGNPAGKSENYRKQDEQGNSGNPLAELDNRNEADLGGNSGRGHGGTGHGNDIRQGFQAAELRGKVSASPDDSSVSSGHVRQGDEGQDSKGNDGLLHSGVHEGRLADGLSELHGGVKSAGHGDGLLRQETASKSEMREIREKCKEILKKPDSKITEDEKKILALYEGGGGLKEQNATSNETLNAFYTPRNVIKAVWSLADHYAPNAKTVLEPASGTGRFAESRPQNEFTLHEADETSARIAKILHPNANVIQGEFQAQFFDENGIFRKKNYEMPKYDLVIGNPPYGSYTGEWKGKGEGKEHSRYEEYFIEKGLDSLKDENSVLAFVVPSGWLRSGIDGIKHRIAEKGELIDAYRLPNKAFPTTEVGTDIIVMRSWDGITEEEKKTRIETETEKNSGDTWFKNHPEKVLGETKEIINRFGKPDFEVVLPDGVSLDDELRKIDEILENDAEKLSDDYEMSEKEFSNFTNNLRHAEEDFLQGKDQEDDEIAADWANADFERTQRLNEIISEIKKSDFKLEVSIENNLCKVVLTNKDGDEIFSEKETGNVVMPITSNVAVWANDAESENLKNLADEYFNIISEDGVRGGEYVNKVFEKENKTVSPEEIEEEKKSVQRKIQQLKNELDNPENAEEYAAYPKEKQEVLETIEKFERLSDEDIKNQVIWKKENQRRNEENRNQVAKDMEEIRQKANAAQKGELLSYNETHPAFTLSNKETGRQTSIQPSGKLEENVRKLGKLDTLTEAENVIEKIKSQGFEILSTESRVVIYNDDKFYDFDSYADSGKFNFETKSFDYNFDSRKLNGWDFKNYIDGGLKITKSMKEFEKIPAENEKTPEEIADQLERMEAEEKRLHNENVRLFEKNNGFFAGIDNDDIHKWRENQRKINELQAEIYPIAIELGRKESQNQPEHLKQQEEADKNPDLKTYHTLKKDEIEGLSEVTQEEFNSIIDALYQQPNPDYRVIPPVIKLPQMNAELAKKIGVENANFFMRSEIAHVRPQRKGSYDQSLRIDEMKGMLDFIRTCNTAYIDSDEKHQNFMLAGLDSKDSSRSNKIVFNKDEYGNYIVTVGKVDTFNLEESKYSKVAVGVEPTIWMELNAPSSATMLRPSTTSLDDLNIAQKAEKSSEPQITLTQEELSLAESVIPKDEYNTMLEYAAGGEESDFYKQKIKDIAVAVQNAPKLYETDGQDEHKIVLRYFHPAGTESYITEIGDDGEAFGFTCLNGDWQNAEWGYININELKNFPMMETDLYVPDGMSIERYLGKEHPDIFPEYAKMAENKEQNPEPLGYIKLPAEEEMLKEYGITKDTHATYFVKSTAEFDQFADFEPITNLTGEEAVAKYKELQEKGVHCGIGINIEGDYIFDDKDGNGTTVLIRNNEGRDTLNIYGDSFVKNLSKSDQHSFDVLITFDVLYRTAKDAGLDVENAPYIAEKENELFGTLFNQNQIYDGYASKLATNFVLEKLKAAGIEVVTDKDEFNRILKSSSRVQRMGETDGSKKNALRYHTENILQLNRSIGQYQDNFSGEESQAALKKLDSYLSEIQKSESAIKADDFLKSIQSIMHIDEEKSKTVRHFIGERESNLRISNHSANAVHAKFRPNETSVVIRLSSTKFRTDKNSYLVEYVYNSKDLTKEKQTGIINGLKDWINTGDFTDKHFDREFYSPSKEEYLRHLNEAQKPLQKMSLSSDREQVYGFAYDGKIYLNPDFLTSNVAVHEYTHLWDEYTRRTNPELWQKGMNIFKNTRFFNEVKSDPNYADIADDDNLVLSEVHARICGEMAQKVLERIAKEDGEITKERAIDWNEECVNYLSSEFGFERDLISEDVKEFFATTMTDLMNEKNIFVQKENTVTNEQLNAVSQDVPPQKERADVENKKPFIEEAFERLNKIEPENPLLSANVLNKAFYGDEKMPVQEVRLPQITDRDYRNMKGGNFPWGFKQVFDVETKYAVLAGETKSSANGKVFDAINIVAEMDADGNFKPHFDRLSDDYKKLSDAKKNNLDDLLLEFQKNAKNFQDKFIGEKAGNFYFKDATTNLSYGYRYNTIFLRVNESGAEQIEFDTGNFRFSALTEDKEENSAYLKNCYEKKSDDRYNWYYGKPFYASFDSLYSENGADFNQALEDDSLVHATVDSKIDELQSELENLGWSDEDYKRRDEIISEIVNLPLSESLKMSGLTQDECVEKIKAFNEQKAKNEKDRKESDEKILLAEQDINPKLQKILDSGFELGKEIPLSDTNFETAICSKDAKDKNQTNVFINEEAAFAVNDATFTVTAFNNYPLTKDFLLEMKEKWNGKLNIASSELQIEKPSIDKILEKKQASEKQKNFAVSLSDFVLSKEGYAEKDGKMSKSAEIEGSVVKAVRSGTKTKVFFDKSRFSALEYDAKTDILLLNQDVYDKGITVPLEKSLREKIPNLSVAKDFVIENQHYIDTNGKTIIAPPRPARFNPEKEATMDNEEFARIYGKNWNKDERVFWEATDYKGYVNLSKLSEAEKESLLKDENYVTEQNGKIIHKELFASGNIYRKLEQNEEFLNEGKIDNASYERNRKILEEAKPKPIPVEGISVSVISPFVENYKIGGIPLKDKFLIWATGSDIEDSPNSVEEITDFSVAEISRDDIPPTISWSDVKSYVCGEDLEKIRGVDDDEKRAQIRNQKRNDRKETAEKLFMRFIHQGLTKEEQNDFAEKYNRTFNHEKSPDYSKLPLFVDGMNQWRKGKEFKLYEQQIKGISFLCNKGNGLLAYDVGLGKTACGIVATVEQIQSGRASRPIIVVPKSVIGKWEDDIHELFPDIPVNNLGNFSREQVGAFYDGNHGLNIPSGSITLVTKDALNNICFGKKVIDDYLFKDYADLLSMNDDLNDQNPNVRAKAREKIYEKAGVAEQVRSIYYIQWDKTGFDHITVDEAHAYKNLFKVPRPKKGETSEYAEMGSGEPSKRALKMFNMTQIIQQQNENRNVFMLTATPFTNSALEVYSMLSYIARKELEENGIKDLNDFCKQYAMTRYEKAVTKGGKDIKYKNVMKSFNDLPGLQNILKQYIDKVDGAEQEKSSIDFRHSFVRPKKETHTVFLDTTDLQERIFDFAVHVMDYTPSEKDIAKRQKNGKKGFAPTLEAMNLMRTACLSPALVDSDKLNELLSMVDKKGDFGPIEIPPLKDVVECSPKLKMVCDTVISNWKAHKDCGQVIYMPEGTEAYPHIINYMEKNGVPRGVFATIDGSTCKIAGKNVTAKMIGESSEGIEDDEDIASDKRAFVAEKFNDKKNPCKILIGSSAISEGMDLNGNSIALYNCMLGWNPTEDVQVEGRIWRQGNEQGKVHIVYPLVYDSIDSLLYQKHSEKQSRINALFDYKDSSTLNVEDINPEELKYELIKDPVIRAKLEIGDKQIELKKEIVLLENQLKDYDQLVESRMKYKERLAEKEMAKNSYIQNYSESVAKGNAKRSPEEQKEGIARFDKSISDCEKQIENVKRKFAGMEIFTEEDEHNFAAKIIQKKELIQKDIDSLFAPEYQKKVIEKYQKILFEEKLRRTQKEAEEPLDKTIQSDMKPMHIVEHEKKLEKYQRFMKIAEKEGDKKMVQILNENWKEYEDFYQKKYGEKKADILENQEKTYLKPVLKTEVVPMKIQENQDSIIKVLHHEIEKIDLEKTKYDSSYGLLFDFPEESAEVRKVAHRVQHSQAVITAENFAENLEKSLKGIELQKENILKAANHLIQKMTNEEKMKFVKLSVQLGVNNAEKTNEFFTKMAKGELKLVPNKKPPVIHKKTSVAEEMSI